MKKNKGNLISAGRPYKWRGRQTKVIRVPVEFAEKIIELIDYMDANRGELPENFPKYIPDPGELPYPRASFYLEEESDDDDFYDESASFSHSFLRQMTPEEMEVDAEWRKSYLESLMKFQK